MLPHSLWQNQGPTARAEEHIEGQRPSSGGSLHSPCSPRHPSGLCRQTLLPDGNRDVGGCAEANIPREPSLLPTGTFQSRVPSTAAEACCTALLFKTTRSPCNWISLRVRFWLSVWKQNSAAKHYFFFMLLLLLLCQGSGINFGHFIKKSPLSSSLAASSQAKQTMKLLGLKKGTRYYAFY